MKDLLIFDMDGVLVDVTESYRATIQATVKHFTGNEPSHDEIQDWKNRGGWNDDWQLSTRMIQERGGSTPYDEVVDYFQKLFHGDGTNGLILREQWLAVERPLRPPRRTLIISRSSPDACAGKRT